MNCPKCNSASIVIDSRKVNGARQRKRCCKNLHNFFTSEMIVVKWDYIDPRVKKPGTKPTQSRANMLKKTKIGKLALKKNSPAWVRAIYMKINK